MCLKQFSQYLKTSFVNKSQNLLEMNLTTCLNLCNKYLVVEQNKDMFQTNGYNHFRWRDKILIVTFK